jgi:hypothetical protein
MQKSFTLAVSLNMDLMIITKLICGEELRVGFQEMNYYIHSYFRVI